MRILADSCDQGDFNGTLDYFTLSDENLSLTCKELVERDSHLCHYDVVRKHCCASCKNVEIIKGESIRFYRDLSINKNGFNFIKTKQHLLTLQYNEYLIKTVI